MYIYIYINIYIYILNYEMINVFPNGKSIKDHLVRAALPKIDNA